MFVQCLVFGQVEEMTQTRPFHVATIRLLEERDPAEHSQETKS